LIAANLGIGLAEVIRFAANTCLQLRFCDIMVQFPRRVLFDRASMARDAWLDALGIVGNTQIIRTIVYTSEGSGSVDDIRFVDLVELSVETTATAPLHKLD